LRRGVAGAQQQQQQQQQWPPLVPAPIFPPTHQSLQIPQILHSNPQLLHSLTPNAPIRPAYLDVQARAQSLAGLPTMAVPLQPFSASVPPQPAGQTANKEEEEEEEEVLLSTSALV